MVSLEKTLKQVSHLCRKYPGTLTASEVVGRAFLLLGSDSSITEKVQVLMEGLPETELLKLFEAAKAVERDLVGEDGFKLGMASRPAEGDACGIAMEDQMVPLDFVRELKQALEKSSRALRP